MFLVYNTLNLILNSVTILIPDLTEFLMTHCLFFVQDDYINASRVKQLTTHSPKFVATQAPTQNTLTDFWMMVWQEQVRVDFKLNSFKVIG